MNSRQNFAHTGAGGHSEGDERVRQLESQLRQYAEENRVLEERLRAFEGTSRGETTPSIDADTALSAFAELREVLKIVDTKYAFDTLNSVQTWRGNALNPAFIRDAPVLRTSEARFRRVSERRRICPAYEASGLYDCDGFEVPPAGSVKVKVVRKGWAFNARGKWLPVRRARVVACRENEARGAANESSGWCRSRYN